MLTTRLQKRAQVEMRSNGLNQGLCRKGLFRSEHRRGPMNKRRIHFRDMMLLAAAGLLVGPGEEVDDRGDERFAR
jgi:hypothetical protein